MELDLSSEEQLPQLAVRGLAHGLGLHAHLVLVRRELIGTGLLVPQVEEAAGRGADHHQLAVKVLPVQVHVLQTPAFDVAIKTACRGLEQNHFSGVQQKAFGKKKKKMRTVVRLVFVV